ncbi:MAG: aminodeoxychorismate lyase [Pseudomonadota bacterium]|nr:aminodeoxychorismate lyase [Pseudomonadota bacterium]
MQTFCQGVLCTQISPNDRAFLYGDGVFTSVRVRLGQPRLWPQHQARLLLARQRLGLQFDLAEVRRYTALYAQQLQHGTLKIIISRGESARGYLPPNQPAQIYYQLISSPMVAESQLNGLFVADQIESGILQQHQIGYPMTALVGLKTLNRLEQVLLRQALASTSWPEALVCDLDGRIIEGVQSNCWLLIDGQWVTPRLDRAGVAGVMRTEIMQRMQHRRIVFDQLDIPSTQADQIQALFFCNAITGILAVKRLDGRALQTKPVDSLLADLLS